MPVLSTNTIPSSLVAGDSLAFDVTYLGYSSRDYTGTFVLSLLGVHKLTVTATPNSDGSYKISITSTQSATLPPGQLTYSVIATSSTERATLETGMFFVKPNPTATLTPSDAQNALAEINTAITALSAGTLTGVTINGQTWTKKNFVEMLAARDRLQAQVNAELRALGLSNKGGSRTIQTRFYS